MLAAPDSLCLEANPAAVPASPRARRPPALPPVYGEYMARKPKHPMFMISGGSNVDDGST